MKLERDTNHLSKMIMKADKFNFKEVSNAINTFYEYDMVKHNGKINCCQAVIRWKDASTDPDDCPDEIVIMDLADKTDLSDTDSLKVSSINDIISLCDPNNDLEWYIVEPNSIKFLNYETDNVIRM